MSAVTAGVKDVRESTAKARQRLAEHGQGSILFLDEVHRFNKAQQDALLPSVEEGLLTLVGATTENPYFEVNAPLMSRSTLFRLEPLSTKSLRALLDRALEHEGHSAEEDALVHLADKAEGDARTAYNALEVAMALAHAVVYLATAPKSNRAYLGLRRAQADVRDRPAGQVPTHLRDASYYAARKLGHGEGYDYPHDDPRGWVPQSYRPPEVEGRTYYEPSEHGAEREVTERMKQRHEDDEAR